MNELRIFESAEFGEVRTVFVDGDPWFVASDICKALELLNPTMAMQRLDEDEKAKFNLGLSGGETNCVNEYGLYSLVLSSRKPEAKVFKRWITHEVIPAIRKTGTYSANTLPTEISPELKMLQGMLNQMIEKERADMERDRQIALAKETARKAVETTENIKEAVKPIFDNWREEINSKFNRIQRNAKKPFDVLRTEMYGELERRAGCDLNSRLRNRQERMRKGGQSKTDIEKIKKMDIIEGDKKLREIFSKIISEYEIRFCA